MIAIIIIFFFHICILYVFANFATIYSFFTDWEWQNTKALADKFRNSCL